MRSVESPSASLETLAEKVKFVPDHGPNWASHESRIERIFTATTQRDERKLARYLHAWDRLISDELFQHGLARWQPGLSSRRLNAPSRPPPPLETFHFEPVYQQFLDLLQSSRNGLPRPVLQIDNQ